MQSPACALAVATLSAALVDTGTVRVHGGKGGSGTFRVARSSPGKPGSSLPPTLRSSCVASASCSSWLWGRYESAEHAATETDNRSPIVRRILTDNPPIHASHREYPRCPLRVS